MKYVETRELAYVLGKSKNRLSSWVKQGIFPVPNIPGRPHKWLTSVVHDWIMNLSEPIRQDLELAETSTLEQRLTRVMTVKDALKQQMALAS